MRRRHILAAITGLLLGAGSGLATEAPPSPWEVLLNAVQPYHQVDTQQVTRAALEAALRALDPHAVFLPHDVPDAPRPTNFTLLARADLWPEQIVRLQIRGLYALNAEGVDVIRRWLVPKPEGLILDLRGADGDDLDTLDALCGLFFTDGTPLYTLRDGHAVDITTRVARAQDPAPPLPPTVVLVNGETRGASETLAAILRNHAGLMLLGSSTHGDSARRRRIPFTAEEDLLLATQWLVPASGSDYQRIGVPPHIAVIPPAPAPVMTQAVAAVTNALATTNAPAGTDAKPEVPDLAARIGDDYVLRRAVDILLGLQALREP